MHGGGLYRLLVKLNFKELIMPLGGLLRGQSLISTSRLRRRSNVPPTLLALVDEVIE